MTQTLPNNLNAEAALLGAILFDGRQYSEVSSCLKAEDFYHPVHQEVYRVCGDMLRSGRVVDDVTLIERFSQSEALKDAGGVAFIEQLIDAAAHGPEITDYARMVAALAGRRKLIETADALKAGAIGGQEQDPEKLLADFDADLEVVRKGISGDVKRHWTQAPDTVVTMLRDVRTAVRDGLERGLTVGIPKLDIALGGLKSGDLVIVAGASSMGKTCVARNMAFGAAFKGRKVAFFSQEMSKEQLAMRLASAEGRRRGVHVPYHDLDNGTVTIAKLDRLDAIVPELPANIVINADSSQTAQDVRVKSRAAARMLGGLDLIVIDYLQIMNITTKAGNNRAAAVGEATAALKGLAKEMGCPVIVLSQLARLKGRDDKRPQLDDLRDSGSIEQDADKVLFVYRENYYISRNQPAQNSPDWMEWAADDRRTRNLIEINIAKNRMGRVGPVELWVDMGCDLLLSDEGELGDANVHSMEKAS